MKCPVCSVALVMSERQGVEIDYCPQCRGVWLDRGELDKIIEKAGPGHPEPYKEPRNYHGGEYGKHSYEHKKQRKKSFLEELFD